MSARLEELAARKSLLVAQLRLQRMEFALHVGDVRNSLRPAGLIGGADVKVGSEGYPPDLETLVEGVSVQNDASGRKLKFLRRVPIDPMTKSTEWGMRSYQDKADSTSWGGQNVFDVYTKSEGTALDGTKDKDW